MAGAVQDFLTRDHVRLDALLARALADPQRIDAGAYREFRAGLLRHIAMEEKVLLPEAKRRNGGVALPVAKQLRADHAALAALLVPTPSHALLHTVRDVLIAHNPLEEGPDGLYAVCDRLLAADVGMVLERLAACPEVPLAPHFDAPRAHSQIARLLQARSGSRR